MHETHGSNSSNKEAGGGNKDITIWYTHTPGSHLPSTRVELPRSGSHLGQGHRYGPHGPRYGANFNFITRLGPEIFFRMLGEVEWLCQNSRLK